MRYAQGGNTPHEIYNFYEATDGNIYGYLPKEGGRNLVRLGADADDTSVDGITVIFISDGRVCGYYLNATIFGEPQIHPDHLKAGGSEIFYVAKVKPADATVIPDGERTGVMEPRPKGTFPVLYGNAGSEWAVWFETWRKQQEISGTVISEKKRKKHLRELSDQVMHGSWR